MTPLAAECALVAIGVPAILRAEPRWGIGKAADAAQIPRRLRSALSGFLGRAEPVPPAALPPFDYDETRELIDGREENAARAVNATFAAIEDSDVAQAVIDRATAIVSDLAATIPRNVRHEITGDVQGRPSDTEIARFALRWAIASDPAIVLADLAEHTLCGEQADAFRLYWPALHEALASDMVDLMIAIKAKRPRWELDTDRDRLVRMLLGMPRMPTGVGADALAGAAAERAAQSRPTPAARADALKIASDLSEGQRAIGAGR